MSHRNQISDGGLTAERRPGRGYGWTGSAKGTRYGTEHVVVATTLCSSRNDMADASAGQSAFSNSETPIIILWRS